MDSKKANQPSSIKLMLTEFLQHDETAYNFNSDNYQLSLNPL